MHKNNKKITQNYPVGQVPTQTDELIGMVYPGTQVIQLDPVTQVAQPDIHAVHTNF